MSLLNIEEEQLLLQYISNHKNPNYKRLRRKLLVREAQRKSHLEPFNLDSSLRQPKTVKSTTNINSIKNIPSCYGEGKKSLKEVNLILRIVAEDSVMMNMERISPYTNRKLKPFIRRDENILPPWLQIMLELQHCVISENINRASLDFCYVMPNHIPVINSLCEYFFWPGIDCKFINI